MKRTDLARIPSCELGGELIARLGAWLGGGYDVQPWIPRRLDGREG